MQTTQFPGVQESGDGELLWKAPVPIKINLNSNLELMELLTRGPKATGSTRSRGGGFSAMFMTEKSMNQLRILLPSIKYSHSCP